MKYNVMVNPLPRCRQCNEQIIFPVTIPPVKRAAPHTYNTWRIQCIFDKDLCRKCHQRNLTILDRLRPQELIIDELISSPGEGSRET